MRQVINKGLSPREQLAVQGGWIGLAALVFGVFVWLVEQQVTLLAGISFGIAAVLIALYLWRRWRVVLQALTKPQTLSGANAVLFIAALVGIVVLLNYLSARHRYQIDLTKTKRFTLAPVSKKVVRSLKQDVEVTAWVNETSFGGMNPEYQKVEDLLAQYQAASPRIRFRVRDPRRFRDEALRAGVKSFPVIIMSTKDGRRQEVTGTDEKDITLGFIKLVKGSRKKIYFAVGHGMRSLDDFGPDGLNTAKDLLESLYHKVATVDLIASRSVPRDCAALVLVGPKSMLLPSEEEAIQKYLDAGGRVLIFLEPMGPDLKTLLAPWGVSPRNDLVLDERQNAGSPAAVAVTEFDSNHPTTKQLRLVILDGARSLSVSSVKGVTAVHLMKTSKYSWGETDLKTSPARPGDKDARGPLTVAVAVTKELGAEPQQSSEVPQSKKVSRLVVVGNSSLPTNQGLQILGVDNLAFFSMLMNWLVEDEMLLDIPPKPSEEYSSPVVLTSAQRRFVVFVNWLGVPLCILAAGIAVWWRRR
jgi:ABC-type uncharacterized transport system involved in gliding motility auxiliary subunit